eukprot:TRINITY_DN6990_c0_g1_i2.p1 TRINITY_DN6990_c0_g1~~TRINITY_DN6990_c0_g1_i2.p1  ORF type:complete len:444 (-),score=69.20 TRINITY_DN6990_c0_g1_i2:98-1429(-)
MSETGDAKCTDTDLKRLEELARDAAVGSTMYDKRWVIENILQVGRHFQSTSYVQEDGFKELDEAIEEKMMTLWDISVEEDVSKFYLEYGVLDFFVELFSNPNLRVKEISMGIVSNMVYHESTFPSIMDKDICLEGTLKLLEEKDSPTLLIVFRCLHSFGYNLFNMIHRSDDSSKEESKNHVEKFLMFLSVPSVVQNIGFVMAGCKNRTVLQNCARFLSILSELWDFAEDRKKMCQHYSEEPFLQCTLEGIKESIGEDKTEKHFMVFLYLVFERDLEKDLYSTISTQTITLCGSLLKEHILEYSSIDECDLEFLFNISYVMKSCLDSGEYLRLPSNILTVTKDARKQLEKADIDEDHLENKVSILAMMSRILEYLDSCTKNGETLEGRPCGVTPRRSNHQGDSSPFFRTPRDTPRSLRDTPGRGSPWSSRTPGGASTPPWRTPR